MDKAIKNSEELEKSTWFGLDRNRLSLLPRALLMKAYVFTAMQNDADALIAFDEAENEYRRRQSPLGQAYALDGKANLLIERARLSFSKVTLTKAYRYLDLAVNLVPDYDSALYHKAEIKKARTEHQIDIKDCKTAETIADARSAFEEVTKHRPNFAIAYYSHAELLANWLNFLLWEDSAAACVDQPALVIDKLELQADNLFRDSITYDNSSGATWLQWGLLTRERQLFLATRRPETVEMGTKRLDLLDMAIFRMNKAVQLDSKDFYAAYRLAKTLQERAESTPAVERDERDQYLKKALTEACLSYRVTPTGNVEARNDSLKLVQSLGTTCP